MSKATNTTDKSSPSKSSQTHYKKGRRESTTEESLFKVIESIKQPHDKIIQVDAHFNRKVPLTENGIGRIYSSDKKSLDDKQNFVYILGNYKFAGPSSSVDKILETMGINKNDISNILVNFTNYQTHRDLTLDSTLNEKSISLSNIRDLVKSKKPTVSPHVSPTGKRVSSKTKISKSTKSVSETLEKSVQSVSDLVKTLKLKNKGLDISKVNITDNTITGVRQYEIKELQPRLKKLPIKYAEGFLIVENKQNLSNFLTAIGHSSSEISTLLHDFESLQSKLSSTQKNNATSTTSAVTSSTSAVTSTTSAVTSSTSVAASLTKSKVYNVRTEKLSPRS
jgi:hypothetical protein